MRPVVDLGRVKGEQAMIIYGKTKAKVDGEHDEV